MNVQLVFIPSHEGGWCSLVVVCYAVDVAVLVHREGDPVQCLGAHHAAEAARVVRVAHRLQDLQRKHPPVKRSPPNGRAGLTELQADRQAPATRKHPPAAGPRSQTGPRGADTNI